MTALGDELHRLRALRGLSLRELSRQTGISNPYLSQIERGTKQPSARILHLLAKPLHVSAEHLLQVAGIITLDMPSTEDVLMADTRLTVTQREALQEVYRAFVVANNGQRKPKAQ